MKLSRYNVPNHYRPAPFWSWNSKLDPEELRWQIREMAKVGLGGFMMHARGGLQTEYLSQEWLDCTAACIEEADKYGMDAWLYDENGWPSGFGGGLVNGLGLDYQQKFLRHEIIDAALAADREHTIAFYSPDGQVFLGTELPAGTTGKIMRCFFEVNLYYVDNLDAKVVKEFIRVTHEYYYQNLPDPLQKHLRGIFTDEPQISRGGLPWSFVLENEYRSAYNRELLPELPKIFLDLPGCAAVRIRFWSLCARLFRDNFQKQIYDWCSEHNWLLIGHHVLEEDCQHQINANGAIMPQYRYYHIPGLDHLTRMPGSQVTAVQVVSSADQFGQKQILTEDYACTGWACNFNGMRWIYQPQMTTGVNFLILHLSGYSLRGLRKRDYPAGLFYHQPWWKDFAIFNDSVARTGMFLAEGEHQTNVLIVHAISSAWKIFVGDEADLRLDHYSKANERIIRALHYHQLACHFADEEIVRDAGSVRGNKFIIGNCTYDSIVIPQVSNLSGNMAELLKEYHANGGRIFVVRNQAADGPLTIDGEIADDATRSWFESLPTFRTEMEAGAAVAACYPDRVIISSDEIDESSVSRDWLDYEDDRNNGAWLNPAPSISSTWRDLELDGKRGRFYYLANASYFTPVKITVSLPRTGKYVEILDMVTGHSSILEHVSDENGRLRFSCTIAAADSLALFVTDTPESDEKTNLVDPMMLPAVKPLAPGFRVCSKVENLLTLDRCRYRINGGEWLSNDIISLQAILLKRKADCDLELEMDFVLDDDFDFTQPLQLGVETPERFSFTLNGTPFSAVDEGYLFDKAFRRITLPQNLKPGRNVIGMKTRYTQPESVYSSLEAAKQFETEYNKLTFDSEIESVYLCGDFTLRNSGEAEPMTRNSTRFSGEFTLGAPLSAQTLDITDLLRSGLYFFSGVLNVTQTVEMTAEEIEKISCLRFKLLQNSNSCRLRINGKDAGIRCWEPFAYEVKGLLKEGCNTLELEFTTSLRNMLGPHHLALGESYAISTLSFNKEPNVIDRQPHPYHEGYNFVDFGIQDGEFA